MAFTFQNRRLGYDNIKPGSATGQERTIIGSSVIGGDCTTKPDKDRNGNTSTSVLAVGKRENVMLAPTTNDNTVEETKLTSATTHARGWTSDTSSTSVFYENLGSSNIPGNVS